MKEVKRPPMVLLLLDRNNRPSNETMAQDMWNSIKLISYAGTSRARKNGNQALCIARGVENDRVPPRVTDRGANRTQTTMITSETTKQSLNLHITVVPLI